MPEDDGGGPREAAAQASEPAPRLSGVVDDPDRLPAEVDFEGRWQGAPQCRLVDVAADGVDDRAEGFELFQHRAAEEIADVNHRVRFAGQLDASLGQAA